MATNYVTAKYQEIYDMGTVSGRTTIVGIHCPTGKQIQNMLSGFFSQFRKFRYSGCTVQLVPAAQLPADPSQVSFEAGALTVDPRDLLNPILFHGIHGEDLNSALNQLYSAYIGNNSGDNGSASNVGDTFTSSVSEFDISNVNTAISYYSALSDPSFRKFGIQSGARVKLRPLVHPLVQSNPMLPSDAVLTGSVTGTDITYNGASTGMTDADGNIINRAFYAPLGVDGQPTVEQGVAPIMFTNGLRPLGWLPTTSLYPVPKPGVLPTAQVWIPSQNKTTELPKLFMGVFIFPPSYTQEMYFRLIITHHFEFKDFSTALGGRTRGQYAETIPEPSASGSKESPTTSLEVVDGNVQKSTEGVF
uniref:Capsid protein n=1 Tax=Porcine associated porprismacovirus TaxID=2496634 RepID=A0A482JPS2_9VIRU|nr:capsid protein [Porcine associated porprismacovirus]